MLAPCRLLAGGAVLTLRRTHESIADSSVVSAPANIAAQNIPGTTGLHNASHIAQSSPVTVNTVSTNRNHKTFPIVQFLFLPGLEEPDLLPNAVLHGVSEGLGVRAGEQRWGAAGDQQRRGVRLPYGEQLHPVPDREELRPHSGYLAF